MLPNDVDDVYMLRRCRLFRGRTYRRIHYCKSGHYSFRNEKPTLAPLHVEREREKLSIPLFTHFHNSFDLHAEAGKTLSELDTALLGDGPTFSPLHSMRMAL